MINNEINMILKLKRFYCNNCTIGILDIDCRLFFTLELVDKNNKKEISCIPEGEYEIVKYNSNKFKNCFKLLNVNARSDILIHSGNTVDNTKGCILIGSSLNINDNGVVILGDSRKSLMELNKLMEGSKKNKIIICS